MLIMNFGGFLYINHYEKHKFSGKVLGFEVGVYGVLKEFYWYSNENEVMIIDNN